MKSIRRIKNLIKRLPGINKLVKKNLLLEKESYYSKHNAVRIGQQAVDYKLQLKLIKHEKINVVFICHRPAVWDSLKNVYNALNNDNDFNVFIIAIPNKKELPKKGLNHEIYESEGAEQFWAGYNCINGYNYETKEWYDIRQLSPDYVFYQQPYNDTRCESYKSWNVGTYAKICYVPYAFDFIGNGVLEETSPEDFMTDVSFYFTQNDVDDEMINKILMNYSATNVKTIISGFPRYDDIDDYKNKESKSWLFSKKNQYRVMWTPRWCTNEGNCSFFDYKDLLVKFAQKHTDIALLFRPHPQAFLNWNRTGELTKKEAQVYKSLYQQSSNMSIDDKKTYFDTIFSSDCLISDTSSFIADYFMTGKPIIYCHKVDMFNELSKKMSEGFYWVNNWNELEEILNNLRNGIDDLKEKRLEILNDLKSYNGGSAQIILNTLKQDAKKH